MTRPRDHGAEVATVALDKASTKGALPPRRLAHDLAPLCACPILASAKYSLRTRRAILARGARGAPRQGPVQSLAEAFPAPPRSGGFSRACDDPLYDSSSFGFGGLGPFGLSARERAHAMRRALVGPVIGDRYVPSRPRRSRRLARFYEGLSLATDRQSGRDQVRRLP